MSSISTYDALDEFGRTPLSDNFFMRDFLHSEIGAWHQIRNVPDYPEAALEVGRQLCSSLLEPLHATFGRVHVRSGYRSPSLNEFGNRQKLNCASNESNYGAHIWDYPDAEGHYGATACVVLPWLVRHIENGGHWTDMAWWIHDHLPYNTLYFFPKLAAFNINWHPRQIRRIDSYAAPRGCLTRPGMPNHEGAHSEQYSGFPAQPSKSLPTRHAPHVAPSQIGRINASVSAEVTAPTPEEHPSLLVPSEVPRLASQAPNSTKVFYRAIHTKTRWRRVNSHASLETALHGPNGAAALFAGRVRIDYQRHGEPLFVLVWEEGAQSGRAIRAKRSLGHGVEDVEIQIDTLLAWDAQGHASVSELEALFPDG